MKRILLASIAVMSLGTGSAWAAKAASKDGDAADPKQGGGKIQVVRLSVPDLTADNQAKVEKALAAVDGVKKVKCDLEKKKVVVHGDNGAELKTDKLIAALKEAGFEATAAQGGGGEPGKGPGKTER